MNCILPGVRDIEELMCIVAAQLYNIQVQILMCVPRSVLKSINVTFFVFFMTLADTKWRLAGSFLDGRIWRIRS